MLKDSSEQLVEQQVSLRWGQATVLLQVDLEQVDGRRFAEQPLVLADGTLIPSLGSASWAWKVGGTPHTSASGRQVPCGSV